MEYFMHIRFFYDHLVHFAFIWYIFPGFGIMYQENSGNRGPIAFQNADAVQKACPAYSELSKTFSSGEGRVGYDLFLSTEVGS
jgi:hypothetical protein